MPIRRLNYTKRKKLTREQVRISLSPKARGTPRVFQADLILPAELPANARVFVEAYRSSPAAKMRFDYGTAAAIIEPPEDQRRLTEFDDELPPPLFRVKVTDTQDELGKLLAEAHQIHPIDPDDQPDHRRGILHIHHKDLDGPIWQLDFENAGYEPTLWIDDSADTARELAHEPRFVALVFPAILRDVLQYVLIDDPDLSEDVDRWGWRWFDFAKNLPGMAEEALHSAASPEDRLDWIDRAVRSFSKLHNVRAAFVLSEGDN